MSGCLSSCILAPNANQESLKQKKENWQKCLLSTHTILSTREYLDISRNNTCSWGVHDPIDPIMGGMTIHEICTKAIFLTTA